jgi:ABC-type multidrug transport system fused ATPase/permease subunit
VSSWHVPAFAVLTYLRLVSGTLRSNLDPFNLYDDATLWDALKRVHLVGSSPFDTPPTSKEATSSHEAQDVKQFNLDSIIEDEGNNISVGQVSNCYSGVFA